MRVGKVAIERKDRVVDQPIDPEMKALDRFAPRRDTAERGVELCQVPGLDDDVEFAKPRRPERACAGSGALSIPRISVSEIFPRTPSSATSPTPGFRSHQMVEVHAASQSHAAALGRTPTSEMS